MSRPHFLIILQHNLHVGTQSCAISTSTRTPFAPLSECANSSAYAEVDRASSMAPQTPSPLPSMIQAVAGVYNDYVLPHLPDPVQSISNNISPFLISVNTAISSGDIVSLAAFLLTVYLSLKIADYLRRSVIGWVIFMVKVALGLALVQVAFYVNQHGWQNTLNQAEWLFGLLWGMLEDKFVGSGGRSDNRTRGFGNGAWSNAYGGSRKQQLQAGRRQAKGRSGYGWT